MKVIKLLISIIFYLVVSLEVSNYIYSNMNNLEFNKLSSMNYVDLQITSEIDKNNFIEIINDTDDIYIQQMGIKNKEYCGSAIFFNKKLEIEPHMIKGRFFNDKDFKNNEALVVIGKNLIDDVDSINNEKIIYIDNIKYKVIGIMGGEGSYLNNTFFVNLNFYNNISKKNTESYFRVDSLISEVDSKDLAKTISNKVISKDLDAKVIVQYPDSTNELLSYLEGRCMFIIFIVIIIFLGLFKYFNKDKILTLLVFEILSLLIGFGLHYILYLVYFSNIVNYSIEIINFIILSICAIIFVCCNYLYTKISIKKERRI